LSPLSNLRTDRWGGSLENRSRYLVDVIVAIRAATGPRFPIGVKLNVFEYQKGDFTSAECVELAILNGTKWVFGFATVRYRRLKKNAHRLLARWPICSWRAGICCAARRRRMPALRQRAAQTIGCAPSRRAVAHLIAG
jgi:hypothetical protein